MKKNSVLMLVLVLVGVAGLLLSGCVAPGLTKKEVDRRHPDADQK
jgi:hypothetical protein